MSFVEPDDVMNLTEELLRLVSKEAAGISLPSPFPRLTYQEARSRYGTDKPDRRFGLELRDLNEVAKQVEFKVFRETVEKGGQVSGLVVKGGADIARNRIDRLIEVAKEFWGQGPRLGQDYPRVAVRVGHRQIPQCRTVSTGASGRRSRGPHALCRGQARRHV